jgi:hypothetical protein
MNPDQILSRTFAAHADLAPDADRTLAGVLDRVNRPRVRLAPTVAVAAATVAVVGGAAVVLDRPAPTPTAPATAPAPTPTPVLSRAVVRGAGWLPAGRVRSVLAAVDFDTQLRGYQVTPAGGPAVYVLVTTAPGTALPTGNKRGRPVDLTVGGRPAREWAVRDWYTVAVRQADDTVATVNLSVDTDAGHVDAAALAATGRRVAAALPEGAPEPIRTSYGLTALPAGTTVRSTTVSAGGDTRYVVAGRAATAQRPGPRSVEVAEQPEVWADPIGKPREAAAQGEPVLGRPTYVTRTGALWVDGVRPGRSILLTPLDRTTTLADLYRVARGVRWTG